MIGAEIELICCLQLVLPLFRSSEKVFAPDEKITLSSAITISDETKKSVALAYNESAVFLDHRTEPVSTCILYISAEEVIAIKSPTRVIASDNKFCDLLHHCLVIDV